MENNLSFNDLAYQGELLCKSGDFENGLKCFESSLAMFNKIPSTDKTNLNLLPTVSVIYNQMGNAYFYLQDYEKALIYHKKDLDLCEKFNDDFGKAKSCGNIGNTLQLIGDFDEAILYSFKNLDISIKLNDLTGQARSLYNLGNIFQAKGKHMGRVTFNDELDSRVKYDLPEDIKNILHKAVLYYKRSLKLVSKKDKAAEGRTYGNLGNTYYLLNDFESAIECHTERLNIAREFGDRSAERRAYINLANSRVFQKKYREAAELYINALSVANYQDDKVAEAQIYFNLGNVYSLMEDHFVAIDFHLRHLDIACLLGDKIGELRAYWSLGNAHAANGDLNNATVYARKHLGLAQELGDTGSQLTAKMNLYEYQNMFGNRQNETNLNNMSKFICFECLMFTAD